MAATYSPPPVDDKKDSTSGVIPNVRAIISQLIYTAHERDWRVQTLLLFTGIS